MRVRFDAVLVSYAGESHSVQWIRHAFAAN
jgi:hypothetical protein